MDAKIKEYVIAVITIMVVVYAIAHINTLREKVLGLPALSA